MKSNFLKKHWVMTYKYLQCVCNLYVLFNIKEIFRTKNFQSLCNIKIDAIFEIFGKKKFKLMCHTKMYDWIRDIIEKTDADHNNNAWSASLSALFQIMKKS